MIDLEEGVVIEAKRDCHNVVDCANDEEDGCKGEETPVWTVGLMEHIRIALVVWVDHFSLTTKKQDLVLFNEIEVFDRWDHS